MARAIVIPEPEKVTLADIEMPPLGESQLRLRTRSTLLSTGTETTILHRRFASDTHWARMFARPRTLGYSCVAEVIEVAPGVSGFAVGDRVVAQVGHASEHVVDAGRCTLVPDAISDHDATWFALAKVAYVAADVSGAGLGTRVLVVGAGPVGQMAIRWLAAQGAYVVVAERRTTVRTELARAGGAAEVGRSDTLIGQAGAVGAANGGATAWTDDTGAVARGEAAFEVVVDSTGNPRVFADALGTVADHGRLVVLGDVGDPSEQRLTSDLITRGLTVVGAHGNHVRGEREHQVRQLFFRLVVAGRFPLDGLVTHTFVPERCAEAYALVENDRANSLGVVFDWNAESATG